MKMTKQEVAAYKKAGFTIPSKSMWGNDYTELRAAAMKEGYHCSKDMLWIFPDDATCRKFEVAVGIDRPGETKVTAETKQVEAVADSDLVGSLVAATVPAPKPDKAKAEAAATVERRKERKLRMMNLPDLFMVGGSITTPGAIRYYSDDERVSTDEVGGIKQRTETKTRTKIVTGPEEEAAAKSLSGQLRAKLKGIVRATPFGWMCPVAKEKELDELIVEAEDLTGAFNAEARWHFVRFSVLKGQVPGNKEKAAQEFAYEMQKTFQQMKQALEDCDVKKIRAMADKAKELKPLYTKEDQDIIQEAIESARAEARQIVKAVGAKGEKIEEVKDTIDTSIVESSRLAFLDYEAPKSQPAPEKLFDKERFQLDEQEPEAVAPAPMSKEDNERFQLDIPDSVN